jgi:hypothetical protein
MTDQNNAAQAAGKILTYLGFAQAMGMEPGVDRRRDHIQSLIESTLLSKLRAEGVQADEPVTDAQETFATWWNDQDEGSIQFDLEQYPQDLKATLNNLWNTAWRAGLASAPVAGEAQPVAWRALWTLPTPGMTAWHDTRKVAPPAEAEMRAKGYSLELAFAATQASAEPLARYCPGCGSVGPVGDEYRDCCPDGNQARIIPARLAEKCRDTLRLAIQALLSDAAANDGAAPQASEAVPDVNALMAAEYRQWIEWFHKGRDYDDFLKKCVFPKTQARATIKQSLTVAPPASEAVRILFPTHLRKMWSGGEVQAWLDNHQGITPPTASAKGSLERYRDWRAEQAEADKDGVRSEGHQ